MEYNHDKVDVVALALLYLTLGEPLGDSNRAWKGVAWEVSNRLYEKDWIEDPRNKNETDGVPTSYPFAQQKRLGLLPNRLHLPLQHPETLIRISI
jgi:hypothetical protein